MFRGVSDVLHPQSLVTGAPLIYKNALVFGLDTEDVSFPVIKTLDSYASHGFLRSIRWGSVRIVCRRVTNPEVVTILVVELGSSFDATEIRSWIS